MAKAELTAEQRDHLERHVAGIGHNQGPALLEHSEKIIEHAARHHRFKAELTGIRVMLDMLRSEIAGEYELPATTTGYVSAGLLLVAAITGTLGRRVFRMLAMSRIRHAAIVLNRSEPAKKSDCCST